MDDLGTDACDWARAFVRKFHGKTVDAGGSMDCVGEGGMHEWFHAAIQAGYNAARDLDPNVIQIEARS